eukprot:scaffold7363_cov263-Pinguiococcus_pyrenoidosus.AAC.2
MECAIPQRAYYASPRRLSSLLNDRDHLFRCAAAHPAQIVVAVVCLDLSPFVVFFGLQSSARRAHVRTRLAARKWMRRRPLVAT